jgi:hypothetical protein
MSRHSDARTVLRWGNQWWTGGSASPIEGTVAALAGHFAESPRPLRLRLIYQPDHLETVAVHCPKGSRGTLAAALCGDFPALADPAFAWSHEPVLPARESFSSLLHLEQAPELFGLVAELERQALIVESAWPLPTFLQALPEEWPESGGQTVVALDASRVCAYRHGSDGIRSVQQWRGEEALPRLAEWLGKIPTGDPGEPVLLVATSPEAAKALDALRPLAEQPGVTWLALSGALAGAATLPRHHPAQLLPPAALMNPQRWVMAASLALLAGAAWFGAVYLHDRTALQQAAAAQAVEQRRAEEHARNAAEIAALQSGLSAAPPRLPVTELLQRVSATIPPEIVLSELHASRESITIRGFVAPAGTAKGWTAWIRELQSETPVFRLNTITPMGSGTTFCLQGTFRR